MRGALPRLGAILAAMLVAGGLTGTSVSFGAGSPEPEGTWVYRVQATSGAQASAFSPDSPAIVVDKSVPLPPLVKADRPAEYRAGWWRDKVTVSFADNGDAVLADGTPGVGVNPSSLKSPTTFNKSGTFTVSGQVADYLGWKSQTGSLTVRVDTAPPQIDLKCGDVKRGDTKYATFTAKDNESGLASPPSGSVREDSSVKGKQTLSVDARDNVGHVMTKTCSYNVK